MLSRISLPTYLHLRHRHGWLRQRPAVALVAIGLFKGLATPLGEYSFTAHRCVHSALRFSVNALRPSTAS